MRVVFANNYSMAKAFRDVAAGVYPRQHLYGADALRAAGHDVVVAPFSPRSDAVARRLRYRLGDPRQQACVLRHRAAAYGGDPNSLATVAYLRALRLRRSPAVAVLHTVPRRTARTTLLLRGYDRLICLSSYVRDAVAERFRIDHVTWAPWGPALDFPGYVPVDGDAVVSSGKTNRDRDTLVAALDGTGLRSVVYAPRPVLPYVHVLADLAAASVVAIPLRDPARIAGLSELNDALALGKPVVVTRTPHLADVDVERIGCGIWVEPGDVAGWRAALTSLAADPALRERMGAAGRAYAEESWNADLFGAAVVDALASVG